MSKFKYQIGFIQFMNQALCHLADEKVLQRALQNGRLLYAERWEGQGKSGLPARSPSYGDRWGLSSGLPH